MQIELIALYFLFAFGAVVVSRLSTAFYLQVQSLMFIAAVILMLIGSNILMTGISHTTTNTLKFYNYTPSTPLLLNETQVVSQQTEKTWPSYGLGLMSIAAGIVIATIGLSQIREDK